MKDQGNFDIQDFMEKQRLKRNDFDYKQRFKDAFMTGFYTLAVFAITIGMATGITVLLDIIF